MSIFTIEQESGSLNYYKEEEDGKADEISD